MAVVLVTGPVRSSQRALGARLAPESGLEVTYVVAGYALDSRASGESIEPNHHG